MLAETTPILIGANDNGSLRIEEYITGTLDDVRIYARALDPVEIIEVMQDRR